MSYADKACWTAEAQDSSSVMEAEGVIDYKPSAKYKITLDEARKRALRQIKRDREDSAASLGLR